MSAATDPRLVKLSKSLSASAAVSVVTVGVVVLVAWALDVPALKSFLPGFVAIKANTAAAFVLTGLSLLLLQEPSGFRLFCTRAAGTQNGVRRRVGLVCGLVVALVGLLTSVEYLFGLDLRIDQLLFVEGPGSVATSIPGRMALNTALDFLLVGVALALLNVENRSGHRPAQYAALIAGLVALLALIGYTYGISTLTGGIATFTPMAPPTAVAFLVVGVGVLGARPERGFMTSFTSRGLGGVVARRLLLVAVGVPIVLELLAFWGQKAGYYDSTFESALHTVLVIVVFVVAVLAAARSLGRIDAERTRAEEALGTSRKLVKDILDCSPALIYMLDLEGRFLLVNRRLESLLGVSSEVLLGNTREAILPQGIAAQHRSNDLEVIRTGRPISFEEENTEADEQHFYASQKFPLADPEGHVYAVCGISTDITEQKRTEAEIARRSRHLSVLHQIGSATTSLSLEESLARGLATTLDSLGVEGGAVLLREPGEDALTIAVHRGLSDAFVDAARRIRMGEGVAGQAATKKEPVVIDIPDYPTARLAPLIVHEGFQTVAATPLLAENDVVGVLTMGAKRVRAFPPEELTLLSAIGRQLGVAVQNARLHQALQGELAERRRAEEAIRQLNVDLERHAAELEAANKELEAFSYSVSHDLRAPLRAIDGFSRLLVDEHGADLPPEARRRLLVVRNGAKEMGHLIDDLLTFARLSRQPLRKQTVVAAELVQRVLGDLRAECEGREVDIRVGELPPCEADPALLKQVFVNLLSNALKFTRQRERAAIEVGCKEGSGERVFFVKDNGVGFDMRYAYKLFGVFQRLHRAEEYEGTGVGLAIVQRIVHRHGGRVWAEAEPGKGASFYFAVERGVEHD